MIVDTFLFFNELDLLEIRLHELDMVVDRFVLVEATTTHSGLPKELVFANNRHRFERFLHRIEHITIVGASSGGSWDRERASRNALNAYVATLATDTIVMLSDLDEIPDRDVVRQLPIQELPLSLEQQFFYYWMNCTCSPKWCGTRACYQHQWTTGSQIRATNYPSIPNGGWHFSYLGGVEAVRTKLVSFAHTEFAKSEILAKVPDAILAGQDLFGRDIDWHFVGIDEIRLPCLVAEEPERFAHFFHDGGP